MQFESESSLVGRIYDCVEGNEDWCQVLSGIADFCGVENAALAVIDKQLGYSRVITPRSDPDVSSAYERFWWQHDPTAPVAASMQRGQFITLQDTGREQFFNSAFYQDFWRFSGLGSERLSINLNKDDGLLSCLVLQPPQHRDEITEVIRDRATLIAAHVSRAVLWGSRLERTEVERRLGQRQHAPNYAGMYLTGSEGQLLSADPDGERLLATGCWLTVRAGRLVANNTRSAVDLNGAIRSASDPIEQAARTKLELLPASPAGGSLPLCIEVLPYRGNACSPWGMRPHVMLIAQLVQDERQLKANMLRAALDLTMAEAFLALEILKGDGRAAAAKRCGISVNTARTHLMHIFDKTGVNRQTELIGLLLKTMGEGGSLSYV